MINLGHSIDEHLFTVINKILTSKTVEEVNFVETDNLGEVIEKLAILHIRTWMLEDAIAEAGTDKEIADLKRKIDICFKQKRPKLVQAINLLVENAIIYNKSLREDSVKLYKGIDK